MEHNYAMISTNLETSLKPLPMHQSPKATLQQYNEHVARTPYKLTLLYQTHLK